MRRMFSLENNANCYEAQAQSFRFGCYDIGKMPSFDSHKMNTWCIYIDESGVNTDNPQFIYTAICVPFNLQQEFLQSFAEIVNPLEGISGREIKFGQLLNVPDRHYRSEIEEICRTLLMRFSEITDVQIIRVKAIRKQMRAKGSDLRVALFRKTLECCEEHLPRDHQAMIMHDELDNRYQQAVLLDTFNRFNKNATEDLCFQNCVFVHSNENPFIQFADFIASICYRYYYFKKTKYKEKQYCALLVESLFEAIDERYPRIVELSEHKLIEGDPRRTQALQLASEYDIDPSTAYQIVDKKITLTEVLRRKEIQMSTVQKQNED